VTDYLERAGLTPYLEKLGFNLVGYGCTTCIGNSGPLPDDVAARIDGGNLNVVAVLSGNRNFEGRIHPQVRASYLASPPLVVAYALAGRIDFDPTTEPLGEGDHGPVYLRDLWPNPAEVAEVIAGAVSEDQFVHQYERIWDGDERWAALPTPIGPAYEWDENSTYVREPPFFSAMDAGSSVGADVSAGVRIEGARIEGARILVSVGDSITTDHISPAGAIRPDSPAGRYLLEHGVEQRDFNSYGARRGNHEVMMRGTFANARLRNALAPETEGPWTTHLRSGEVMSVYDAAIRYAGEGTPLGVLAGAEYGSGSSRDWAAKGPALLGVRFVLAESFERIHRQNLVGMGVLPLQYRSGESADTHGLSGRETYSILGLEQGIVPKQEATVAITREDGSSDSFSVILRIDQAAEVAIFGHGGILPMVLREALGTA
jgi:aconitate hydratase